MRKRNDYQPAKPLLKSTGKRGKRSVVVQAHDKDVETNLAAPLVDAAEVADLQKRGHH